MQSKRGWPLPGPHMHESLISSFQTLSSRHPTRAPTSSDSREYSLSREDLELTARETIPLGGARWLCEKMVQLLQRVLARKYELVSFLVPLVVYGLALRENTVEAHFLNVATQYAVWTTGSPSLGPVGHPIIHNIPTDVDTVISNNQYFSAYAPGFSYLSLPFGIFGFLLNGGKLEYYSYAILTDEAFVAICAALAALVLFKICRLYAPPPASLLASFTLAFGTIVWPFSTVLFEHDVAMLFSLLGVYCVLRLVKKHDAGSKEYALVAAAGASIGIASTIEYLSALMIIPLLAFMVYRRKLNIFSGSLFGLTFIPGPILDLVYNQYVTGSPLVFPEDLLVAAHGQSALSRFDPSQLLTVPIYNLLSPNRGLFLISPVLLLGVYGIVRMYRSDKLRGDALLFISIFLLGLFPYSAWSDWWGGYAFGPRFLIDVLPFLVIPIACVLSDSVLGRARTTKVAFLSLFLLSSFIAGAAAFTSAEPIEQTDLGFYQPIAQSIPWLLHNNLDVWWFRFHPSLSFVIIPSCFLLIWVISTRLLSPKPAPMPPTRTGGQTLSTD